MVLEGLIHDENCFVTLTYRDTSPPCFSLDPAAPSTFIKKVRRAIYPKKVRYFLVGEYGSDTFRPHYHLCMFGIGIHHAALIEKCWGLGFVQVGDFNDKTAAYCTRYVVKKMTANTDPRLKGLHPEFARMSNRPGLGADAMTVIADQLHSAAGLSYIESTGDVPFSLRMGGKTIPLGRYLRRKLREEMGMPESWLQAAKDKAMYKKGLETIEIFETAKMSEIFEPGSFTFKSAFVKSLQGKIWAIEAKDKIAHARKGAKL